MSGDEDDYLADKFLFEPGPSSAPKTYSELRKEADKKAKRRNEQNKLKSRRQREVEAREEGLSRSLFERAKEEEEVTGISSGNKALSMMMRMGFKPGQPLGKVNDEEAYTSQTLPEDPAGFHTTDNVNTETSTAKRVYDQLVEPIPLNEWTGRKGIGLVKRGRSPTTAERVAKMAKMAEEAEEISHRDFRDRARQEYTERRAEGHLGPAQRTCISLDEKAGKRFHVLWLNPNSPNSFPTGLQDALIQRGFMLSTSEPQDKSIQANLRRQIQADALQPLGDSIDGSLAKTNPETFTLELVEEAIQFLRLRAQSRLYLVLSYLRNSHAYCFWCGVQYEDEEAMEGQCPGPDEESHN